MSYTSVCCLIHLHFFLTLHYHTHVTFLLFISTFFIIRITILFICSFSNTPPTHTLFYLYFLTQSLFSHIFQLSLHTRPYPSVFHKAANAWWLFQELKGWNIKIFKSFSFLVYASEQLPTRGKSPFQTSPRTALSAVRCVAVNFRTPVDGSA